VNTNPWRMLVEIVRDIWPANPAPVSSIVLLALQCC
jgi:hypothetical protein